MLLRATFAAPLCMPARASLLTERYVRDHGGFQNDSGIKTAKVEGAVANLWFRVLGPVEAVRDGKPVRLGRSTATLLAALLMSPNRVVPVERLIDWTWGSRLPDHPRAALHNAVSRLRRLAGENFIETNPWGYWLHADPGSLDLLCFDQLRSTADHAITDGMIENAAMALDEAIALWREPLLGNVESSTFRDEMIPELTERYMNAVEERASLHLRLGKHAAVIRDLSRAAHTHRYRERITGILMVALARTGRQAEALAAYQALRLALREDLGVDPGAEVQTVFITILRGDRCLSWPPETQAGQAIKTKLRWVSRWRP